MPEYAVLITCEHAVNHVPELWRKLFAGREEVLQSHRAYDAGALEMAHCLSESIAAPLFEAAVTRLLIDHNRSPHHRALWSEFSRNLAAEQKHALLAEYYRPYREMVARWIQSRHQQGRVVVHISVHSFTPLLDGQERKVDLGVLYDPQRPLETSFGRLWKSKLERHVRNLRIRLNTPYRGSSDCQQTSYRNHFESDAYLGLELEINQALVLQQETWSDLQGRIAKSLQETLQAV